MTVRFGAYELDVAGMELRKNGVRIRLQEQPFLVLSALVAKPGEVVTREELKERVWANDIFVDFDQSLNKAVNRLREVLNDDASQPRYIETVPRRGYRFVAHVQDVSPPPEAPPVAPVVDSASATTPTQPSRRKPRWPYAAAVCVAIIAAVVFWVTRPLPPPRITATVQLTNDGKPKNFPLLTDGSRLYFNSISGTGTVPTDFLPYQVSVKGGEPVALPDTLEGTLLQDISPELSDLLLIGQNRDPGNERDFSGSLWTVPLIGGAPQRVGDLVASGASWSPDGQRIVYSNGHDLLVARNDGTEIHKLASFPGSPYTPRWSPDGTKVRFSLYPGRRLTLYAHESSALWEVSIDGTYLHPLLPGWNAPPQECCGNWTRDGKYFVFNSRRNGTSNIWAIPEKTGWFDRASRRPVQLTMGPMNSYFATPSPDGKRLFVLGLVPRAELVRYDLKSGRSGPYLGGLSALQLEFSRDGNWVAYTSYPQATLWRNSTDGSRPLELSSSPFLTRKPDWSPDGTEIVFERSLQGKPPQLYVVSVDGGVARPLTDGKDFVGGAWDPSWSPDGSSIVFGDSWNKAFAPKNKILHLLNLKTHVVSDLSGSEGMWSPRWSPDGRFLVGISDTARKTMLCDFEKQRQTELAPSGAYPSWSRDGQFVYFDVYGKDRAWWRVRVRDRKLELLRRMTDVPEPPDYWFAPAPDGSIITWRDVTTSEIYALDWEAP
ncbi:MAG: winged helix-turn-helix domain-containing protein [Bryobacteraceae bacterium]